MTLDQQIERAYESQRLLEKRYSDLIGEAANINSALDDLNQHIHKLLQSKYGASYPNRDASRVSAS
jgi:hypothetical protein